jgi:Taurine catabolism dioxygenase TauD, TfdA family
VLTAIMRDPRAWEAGTIDPPDAWYYPLSERCRSALEQTLQQQRQAPRPVTALRLADTPCAGCRDDLQPALQALETGRGFGIITGLPGGRYSPEELQTIYWLVGQLLGRPVEQNVQGTLLYDVRDTGQDVRYGARFSVTNAESTFHTDNSFGLDVLDYVGLLCVYPALTGGSSQVLSAYAVHNRLLAQHREVLPILYRRFHVDRRGGFRPGESPTLQVPILSWDGQELACRYLRYWLEVGHDKAGQPLTSEECEALDVLDGTLRDPALRVEFDLRAGDMFFINNRWILHNRTAFENAPPPASSRHLVRLWLQREPNS